MFISVKEAAEYLKIKPCTLYVWAKRGLIPSYKFGKLIRFKKEDLQAWAENQKVSPPPVSFLKPDAAIHSIKSLIENAKASVIKSHKGKASTASRKGGE